MEISFSSILASVISISLLTCLLYWCIRKKDIVTHIGLGCMYVLLILILFRGFFPIDFTSGLTTSVYIRHGLPQLRDLLLTEIFSLYTFAITPLRILLLIWFVGFILNAFTIVNEYCNIKKKLHSTPPVTDAIILATFQNALADTFSHRKPTIQLVCHDLFPSPALFGIYRPTLILPHLNYNVEELYAIFRHELLHYKHRDVIFKLLTNILSIIYWWNPIISMLFVSLTTQIQELWVDFHTAKTSNKEQKIQYMETLTTNLESTSSATSSKPISKQTLFLSNNYDQLSLKQRFEYLRIKSLKSFSIYGIVICIALFISTFTIILEPSYDPTKDEDGDPVFEDNEGETYFIKNGAKYDLYMENKYVGTLDKIPDIFKDYPIYDHKEEVPQNED